MGLVPAGLCVGGFVIDSAAGALRRGAVRVELRPKTWALLECLAARAGQLCTREDLKHALWPGLVVVDDSLTQCVAELRRALEDDGRRIVHTVARRGYRLDGVTAEVAGDIGVAWESLRRIDGRATIDAARQAFERAYDEGGQRAEALAGIALSHVIDVLNPWSRAPQWQIDVAREAAEEALALDDGLAIASHARAHVAMLQGRHAEARAGFRRALLQEPRLAHAQVRLAVIAIELGRAHEAGDHLDAALARGDFSPAFRAQAWFVRGMAAFHLQRDHEALAFMQEALALRPALHFAHQWKAAIEALEGRLAASATSLANFTARVPGHTVQSLQATERSVNEDFRRERRRLYEGLERAGMPRC
jgi:DNA-binding winged helix-turn-helix (wHTH) protein/Tfp pilus assembly protein PilF